MTAVLPAAHQSAVKPATSSIPPSYPIETASRALSKVEWDLSKDLLEIVNQGKDQRHNRQAN
jgi:hypothetical protein